MEIQSILTSKSASIPLQWTSASTSSENRASSQSTWRKFASDTTYRYEETTSDPDRELNLIEFYERAQRDWEAERFAAVASAIDVILDRHLPAMNGLIRAVLLTLKSQCYEELGQLDLALQVLGNASLELVEHQFTIDEFMDAFNLDKGPLNFLEMRKAGLLLLLGKEEEGFEILRENQPQNVISSLLYHLIEKERGISLLRAQTVSDEEDLKQLFLAGRYEEVIQKTETIEMPSSFPLYYDQSLIELRAGALAMSGRIEEAIAFFGTLYSSSVVIPFLLEALNGDKDYLDREWQFEEEFRYMCPVGLFAKWLLQK